MRDHSVSKGLLACVGLALTLAPTGYLRGAQPTVRIAPDWSRTISVSRTSIGIQDCPEPPLYRGAPTHDNIYNALRDLKGDYSRLQPWFPYPKLAVAELKPPTSSKTYWNFKLMDEVVADFMQSTAGHPVVFQPGTIPAWMTSSAPPRYPSDPKAIDWTYGRDGKFQESTLKLFADYQARVAGWYINGGFTDELGKRHESGHHYKFAYWEPMNEEDQRFTPKQMTRLYDAAVAAVRAVVPDMKFMGPTLADIEGHPNYVAYFLNPANHVPGTPIDMVSYHYYTETNVDESPSVMQYRMYEQANSFLATVGYINTLRQMLLPKAATDIDELGSIVSPAEAALKTPFPVSYWSLSGAVWAYMYGELVARGIQVVNAAELIDYPGQFAATTLVDWDTGKPNVHYWIVKMLRDNFGPGDHLVYSQAANARYHPTEIYWQGFITPAGQRKVLIVNTTGQRRRVIVADARGGTLQLVAETTAAIPPALRQSSAEFELPPSGVAVMTLLH